ncbi:uncharacterized protein BXIN_3095 [Babesia sp. Xinjiang]|uniref:uncharacterized protein n=1 Tax=Babesia sp. Xinjiang TaxID=462227 RepID=UPI000A260789|nr:uncharacterized protein BXIN_3095 [Babesia sp. Xinjiang]ORM39524.1 hypothetical protein BXIN_3095 [Babesia sp. Xinjiang]
MRLAFSSLAFFFAFFLRIVAAEAEDVINDETNALSAPKTKLVFNVEDELDSTHYEIQPLIFQAVSVMSLAPKPGYKLIAIKNGDVDVFRCKEDDEDDQIDEILINKNADGDFILVGSTYGISYFQKIDGKYFEIENVEDIPETVKEFLPLETDSDIMMPVCGSRTLVPNKGT